MFPGASTPGRPAAEPDGSGARRRRAGRRRDAESAASQAQRREGATPACRKPVAGARTSDLDALCRLPPDPDAAAEARGRPSTGLDPGYSIENSSKPTLALR